MGRSSGHIYFDGTGYVYSIQCIETDGEYVGSSSQRVSRSQLESANPFELRRIGSHFLSLEKGSHYSPFFQSDFDKYGRNAFKVEILELFDETPFRKDLMAIESKWQDIRKPSYSLDYRLRILKQLANGDRFRDLVELAEGRSLIVSNMKFDLIQARLRLLETRIENLEGQQVVSD